MAHSGARRLLLERPQLRGLEGARRRGGADGLPGIAGDSRAYVAARRRMEAGRRHLASRGAGRRSAL